MAALRKAAPVGTAGGIAPRAGRPPAGGGSGPVRGRNISDVLTHLGDVHLQPVAGPPHVLEISKINGTPWTNPAFDTSSPTWADTLVGGRYDGSSSHPFEWVSVLNPKVEQDDEVGLSGICIQTETETNGISKLDIPFTHPFGESLPSDRTKGDFEFSIAPDAGYQNLFTPENKNPAGQFRKDFGPAAALLGAPPPGLLGLEVEAGTVPVEDRPAHGDRVAVYGRWIVDAGHQPFHTEIHPPLLMAYARCLDALDRPAAPSLGAHTQMKLWSRPYQAQQLFSSGDKTGLALKDYIKAVAATASEIKVYPQIFPKAFDGVHLVAFTVRPPVGPPAAPGGPAGSVTVPRYQLRCSYYFVVNGACGVEVIPSPSDPNAALVVLALSSAGYPKLPDPPSTMIKRNIGELEDEAKEEGVTFDWKDRALLDLVKAIQFVRGDNAKFRIYNPVKTSPVDATKVVPFTDLAKLPRSVAYSGPCLSPFPVRGWLKIGWVDTQVFTS